VSIKKEKENNVPRMFKISFFIQENGKKLHYYFVNIILMRKRGNFGEANFLLKAFISDLLNFKVRLKQKEKCFVS
jgi:hypothetical protein